MDECKGEKIKGDERWLNSYHERGLNRLSWHPSTLITRSSLSDGLILCLLLCPLLSYTGIIFSNFYLRYRLDWIMRLAEIVAAVLVKDKVLRGGACIIYPPGCCWYIIGSDSYMYIQMHELPVWSRHHNSWWDRGKGGGKSIPVQMVEVTSLSLQEG